MRTRLSKYLLTVIAVAAFFRAGPDIEAYNWPVINDMKIEDVRTMSAIPVSNPVIVDQDIINVTKDRDKVCYTWKFTKRRALPLSFFTFSVHDASGKMYDAITYDMDNGGRPIYTDPNVVKYPNGIPQERHFCTELPEIKEDLTVRGFLVYKTPLNLWKVTHFTPSVIVPKVNE